MVGAQVVIKPQTDLNKSIFPEEMNLNLAAKPLLVTPRALIKFLSTFAILLWIFHLISLFFQDFLPEDSRIRKLSLEYFNLDYEANIPTFFSAFLLLLSSVGLFLIYKRATMEKNNSNTVYWLSLSIIFLFLSMDEAVQIHERIINFMHNMISGLPNFLASAWVIPYALFFLTIAGLFIKFVLGLPIKTRNLFFLSAFTYVFAALGLELPESYLRKEYGWTHVYYSTILTLQEMLEMTGIIIFLYALVDYISYRFRTLVINIG